MHEDDSLVYHGTNHIMNCCIVLRIAIAIVASCVLQIVAIVPDKYGRFT